jgi:hypothetical protein
MECDFFGVKPKSATPDVEGLRFSCHAGIGFGRPPANRKAKRLCDFAKRSISPRVQSFCMESYVRRVALGAFDGPAQISNARDGWMSAATLTCFQGARPRSELCCFCRARPLEAERQRNCFSKKEFAYAKSSGRKDFDP